MEAFDNAPSALDLNFDEIYEMELLPDGEEATLRIINGKQKEKKKAPGEFMLEVRLEDPSDPKKEDIYMYLNIPTAELRNEDPKAANKMMLRIQEFYDTFGVDYSRPVEMSDLIGLTGDCIVGVQPEADGFPEKNFIKSFVKRG